PRSAGRGSTVTGAGGSSALAQHVFLIAPQWRQQVAQDGALAGLDLGRDRHARRQIHRAAVDLHEGPVERDARTVIQFLSGRFAGVALGAERAIGAAAALRLVADDGVLGHALHRAVQQAVAGEVEGIDLDFHTLARRDEADVTV